MVYLDYAATSPILPEVKKAMCDSMDHFFANASALHTPGHQAKNSIEEARERLAKLINANPDEIIFTSGATESNNTVVNIFRGQNVAVSNIEHHSLIESAREFCASVTPVTIDKNGKVCYNNKIWGKSPKLVSISLANNEFGVIQDIKKLAKEAHKNGAFFHSDITQALGKIKINVKELDVDYATFSAHKIGGPVGVGALFIKKNAPFRPFLIGGNQEGKRRGGTYNTINIIGFGAALKHIEDNHTEKIYATKIKTLRDNLAKRILSEIPGSSLNNGLDENYLPNILNTSFKAAEGESIQLYLDVEGIVVSTGSACAAGDLKPSHVLMAKTHDAEVAHSSIRFSFGEESKKEDVEKVMEVLPKIIKKLQDISTIPFTK